MSEWIKCSERMPPVPTNWDQNGRWLATDGKRVTELSYVSNRYAKTEKGRAPRWQDLAGRISSMQVTHWMPLPPPPQD